MVLEWKPVLKDVISETLETMFFTMVEFQDCEPGDPCFDYECDIELQNPGGRIAISLQLREEFARMITAAFLGTGEDNVKEEDLRDSMEELLNMVGGGYHVRINDGDWVLGLPKVWKIGLNRTHRTQDVSRLDFSFFEQPAGSAALSYLPT
jgi:hypothetical protein